MLPSDEWSSCSNPNLHTQSQVDPLVLTTLAGSKSNSQRLAPRDNRVSRYANFCICNISKILNVENRRRTQYLKNQRRILIPHQSSRKLLRSKSRSLHVPTASKQRGPVYAFGNPLVDHRLVHESLVSAPFLV